MIVSFVRRSREQIFVGFKLTYYNDLSFLFADDSLGTVLQI